MTEHPTVHGAESYGVRTGGGCEELKSAIAAIKTVDQSQQKGQEEGC